MTKTATAGTVHIGEVAERTGLSLRTLRHYDEIGLLQPSGRTDGGFRLYTQDDVRRLLVIRRMKPLGFTLAEMQGAMQVIDAIAAGRRSGDECARLNAFLKEARTRRQSLRRQLDMADEFIAMLVDFGEV